MSYSFGGGTHNIKGSFTGTFAIPVSILCWVKGTIMGSDAYFYFGKNPSDGNDSVHVGTGSAATKIEAGATDSAGVERSADYTTGAAEYDDVWVPVLGVFTSSNNRDIYIEVIANTANSGAARTVAGLLKHLIAGENPSGSQPWTGLLAELAVWDKALVSGEITDLLDNAKAPVDVANANLIGYWSLDHDDSTPDDESGNGGPTLTVTGATFDADHPSIVSGGSIVPILSQDYSRFAGGLS